MQRFKNAALVLAGIALGCGGAAVAPMAVGSAQASGKWACYGAWNFPDVTDAAKDGAELTKSMNAVAGSAAAGTIVTVPSSGSAYVCVKN